MAKGMKDNAWKTKKILEVSGKLRGKFLYLSPWAIIRLSRKVLKEATVARQRKAEGC
jgi:hypothetical protein